MSLIWWLGTTDGDAGTAANWSSGSAPVNGDTVVIDGRSTQPINAGLSDLSAVTLAELRIMRGSPAVGTTSAYLEVGATLLNINVPPTDGSNASAASTIAINTGSVATTCRIYGSNNTGSGGVDPVTWKGAHSSNVLYIHGGRVGIATMLPSDTASVPTINVIGDPQTSVNIGSGVTMTTLVYKGGNVLLQCAATTVNMDKGELETRGTGAITTVRVGNGNFRSNSTGTITNLHAENGGTVIFDGSLAPRTVTNAYVHGSGRIIANLPTVEGSAHPITFTNGVDFIDGAESGQSNFGGSITLSLSAT